MTKGASLSTQLAGQEPQERDDAGPVVESFVYELMVLLLNLAESCLNKTELRISSLDLIKLMARVWVNCNRLGTKAFE